MPEPSFDVARRRESTELRAGGLLQRDRPIRGSRLNTMFSGGLAERWSLLAVAVGCGGFIAAVAPPHAVFVTLVVLLSTATCARLAVLEWRQPRLGLRAVVVAIGLVLTSAVVIPPRGSNDVWSYAAYGRMVSVHNASPYNHVPADFRGDALYREVSPVWRHRGSVYGPVFVGFAAVGTFVAGDSPTATRLFFQMSMAAAVVIALALVWRRTRSTAALLWLGLHPLFGAALVNGGHIDALVGLAVLVSAMLAAKRWGVATGVVIGLATLIKLPAFLALVGVVAWGWRQRDRQLPFRAVATASAIVTLGYLPFLPGALRVLHGANQTVTPGSLWNVPAEWLVGNDAGRNLFPYVPPALTAFSYFSLALSGVLAVVLAWRTMRRRRPDQAIGAATASYTIAAEYTLPWYTAWALPVLADRRPSPLAWVVWTQSALLLAAWKLPLPAEGAVFHNAMMGLLTYAAPIAALIAFAGAGVLSTGRTRTSHDRKRDVGVSGPVSGNVGLVEDPPRTSRLQSHRDQEETTSSRRTRALEELAGRDERREALIRVPAETDKPETQ